MSATETVMRLRNRNTSPLDLFDAAEPGIAEIEPHVNALLTDIAGLHDWHLEHPESSPPITIPTRLRRP